jgi:hypothetical protein
MTSLTDGELRQGDLVAVDYFPSWDVDKASVLTSPSGVVSQLLPTAPRVLQGADGRLVVAVCSYDCDLENPRSRTAVALAPVMAIPARPTDDRYAAMRSSALPDAGGDLTYFQLFPIELAPSVGARVDVGVVDFSQLMHLGPAERVVRELSGRVIQRLSDDLRDAFQFKLAAHFGRGSQIGVAPPSEA